MFYKREVISDQYFLFVGIFLHAEGNKCSRCSQMGDGEGVGGSAKGGKLPDYPIFADGVPDNT